MSPNAVITIIGVFDEIALILLVSSRPLSSGKDKSVTTIS
ncbi:MAG: hypothetical protein FD167_5193, partial [bacterium]